MLTVGLTGGIATGKSLVTAMFAELGAAIVDTDTVYHELLASDTDLLMALKASFGPEFFDESGRLDRRKLGAHVFGKPDELRKLNRITHPVIIEETMARVDRLLDRNATLPMVFMVVPLLFEVRFEEMVDRTVLAYAPAGAQIDRLCARDGISREEAQARVAAQMSIEKKRKMADIVVDNSGTVEQTAEQVRAVFDRLMLASMKPREKK